MRHLIIKATSFLALSGAAIFLMGSSGTIDLGATPSSSSSSGGGSSGTVTSVGLSMPVGFTVTGSPVTTAGTLAVSADSESANTFYAGPSSGGAATPTFRLMVSGDVPALPYQASGSYITALTGDGTAAGPGSAALTLASVNGNVGSFGSASNSINFTVNAKGLVTAASTNSIAISQSQVTGLTAALAAKGVGSVTSVALTAPGIFSITGSPITGAGTLAITNSLQAANTGWFGPTSGGATSPSFRALVSADIPAISLASGVNNVLPVANGGTATGTAFTSGSVVFATTSGTYAQDNSSFYYNNSSKRLALGTNLPTAQLQVVGPVIFDSGGTGTASNVSIGVGGSSTGLTWIAGNSLGISANGSEYMRVSSTGNVGIGTTNPLQKLHIQISSTGRTTFDTTDAIIENNGDTGLSILTSDTGIGRISFADVTSPNIGYIKYDHSTDKMSIRTNASDRMVIDSVGNVGIGTTAPTAKIDIQSSQAAPQIMAGGYSILAAAADQNSGTIYVGGSTYRGIFDFSSAGNTALKIGNSYDNASALMSFVMRLGGTPVTVMSILGSGNVGIGTTAPTAQLHTTGGVRFANFGAGSATFDASGNISSISDERLKNVIGPFTRSIADLEDINPIEFTYNKKSGLEMGNKYYGFSAQNVSASIPEAVAVNKDGFLSIQDRALMAVMVNAIKDLKKSNDDLKAYICDLDPKAGLCLMAPPQKEINDHKPAIAPKEEKNVSDDIPIVENPEDAQEPPDPHEGP